MASIGSPRYARLVLRLQEGLQVLQEGLWLGRGDYRTRKGKIFRGSHGSSRPAKDKEFPLIPWWHGNDLDSVPSIPPEPRRYTDVDRPPPAPRLPEPRDL